jgi:hypothetical protein
MNIFECVKWLVVKVFGFNTKYYVVNAVNARFLEEEKPFRKKVITISPSGFCGFYVLGVCKYIKEHYDTSDYLFSGASIGSWISLYMTYKGEHDKIAKLLVDNKMYTGVTISQILQMHKMLMLSNFHSDDFDLDRLFIGVTTFGRTNVHTDFVSLQDAVDCCLASSHIPFMTGPLLHCYKNNYALNGAFSESPYLTNEVLHLHPNIWRCNEKKYDFEEMYQLGYEDTAKYGKEMLDGIFKS